MYSLFTLLQDFSFLHETDLQANLTDLQLNSNNQKHIDDILEDEIYYYDDKDELRFK